MKTAPQSFVLGQLWPLLQRHWFKLGIVLLLLYAFFIKDVSFNVQINNPDEPPLEWQPKETTAKPARREALTENHTTTSQAEASRFDFWPSWGSSKTPPPIEALSKVDVTTIDQFIQRFQHVAEAEEEKFGVPASITLAHGLLLSTAGEASLTKRAHNYFGIQCTDDWQGQTVDGPSGSCLRGYDNAWMSFRDHSLYYTTGQHHRLQDIPSNNIVQWAKALDASPVNRIDQLGKQLLLVIERFEL